MVTPPPIAVVPITSDALVPGFMVISHMMALTCWDALLSTVGLGIFNTSSLVYVATAASRRIKDFGGLAKRMAPNSRVSFHI